MKYKITEFETDKAIIRIHDPHQTPEEKEVWMNRIKEATGRFLQRVVVQRRKQNKQ